MQKCKESLKNMERKKKEKSFTQLLYLLSKTAARDTSVDLNLVPNEKQVYWAF